MLSRSLFSGSIKITEGDPTNSQVPVTRNGLTLNPTPNLNSYTPVKNKALYFLHNSLPWDSQGYAPRSHAIIKSLNSNGWNAEGITRLGYPYDRHDVTNSQNISAKEVIDTVTYNRLGRKVGQISGTFNYISRYCERSASFIQSIKPEIIHAASNYWNGLAATHLAAEVGVPSVYEVRGLWEVTRRSATPGYEFTMSYRFYVKLETQAALQASHVFALTGALRDELVQRGVPENKITLLPNAVDETRFFPIPRNLELEKKFGYEGKTVIGYVGSLLAYEGLDLLLRAAAQLAKVRDDFRVLIVGSGVEHENLMELAKKLGLGDIVHFTGRVPHSEVEQYYSLVDIAPFPRLPLPVCEMVSPLKPFEAMAMEKSCIVSSCAALTEIVQDEVTGRVFEKGSYESLATVLIDMLDNPEQTQLYGKAGRTWVLENRTWSKNAKIVQEVYEKLLAK
jgi:glycosyltransferase involved in cell wall biosynthesis